MAVPDFLFMINYNVWSISYRFRVISICLWTGSDVMPISPLGGVAGRIRPQIMKASHRFTFYVPLQLFAYLLPFRSYSTFLFSWDSLFGGQKIGVFGA